MALWHAIEEIRTVIETNPDSVKEILFNDKDLFGDATLQNAFEEYKHDLFKLNDISKVKIAKIRHQRVERALDNIVRCSFFYVQKYRFELIAFGDIPS